MENKKCSNVNLAYSSLDELLLSIYSTANINANISCGNFDNSTKSLNNSIRKSNAICFSLKNKLLNHSNRC